METNSYRITRRQRICYHNWIWWHNQLMFFNGQQFLLIFRGNHIFFLFIIALRIVVFLIDFKHNRFIVLWIIFFFDFSYEFESKVKSKNRRKENVSHSPLASLISSPYFLIKLYISRSCKYNLSTLFLISN